jgi:hypothetical protein
MARIALSETVDKLHLQVLMQVRYDPGSFSQTSDLDVFLDFFG